MVESLLDFEHEVSVVAEAVGMVFDEFDPVVDSVEPPGVDRVVGVVQDAFAMALESPGEAH